MKSNKVYGIYGATGFVALGSKKYAENYCKESSPAIAKSAVIEAPADFYKKSDSYNEDRLMYS